jgi:hypothetical protein
VNMQDTVIILNSPPSGGKDTIAEALCLATGAKHMMFKHRLYELTAKLFGISVGLMINISTDRTTKEAKILKFDGKLFSPRGALIFTSEKLIKPMFGNDYFGKYFASHLDRGNGTISSDGGFEAEVYPCIDIVGINNIFIIQFTREGSTTFEGDSRDWVNIKGVETMKTTNDGTVEEIVSNILGFVLSCKSNNQESK